MLTTAGTKGTIIIPGAPTGHVARARERHQLARQAWHKQQLAARQRESEAREAVRKLHAKHSWYLEQRKWQLEKEVEAGRAEILRAQHRLNAQVSKPRVTGIGPRDARTVVAALPQAEDDLPPIESIGSPSPPRRSASRPLRPVFAAELSGPYFEAQADVVGRAQHQRLDADEYRVAQLSALSMQIHEATRVRRERSNAKLARMKRELDEGRWHMQAALKKELDGKLAKAQLVREQALAQRKVEGPSATPDASRASSPMGSMLSVGDSPRRQNLMEEMMRPSSRGGKHAASMPTLAGSSRPVSRGGMSCGMSSRPASRGGMSSRPVSRGGMGGSRPVSRGGMSVKSSVSEPRLARGRDGGAVALGTSMRPATSAAAFRGLHHTVGVPVDAPTGMSHEWWASWLENEAPPASMHLRDLKALQF